MTGSRLGRWGTWTLALAAALAPAGRSHAQVAKKEIQSHFTTAPDQGGQARPIWSSLF
jgi:hypothetical protein